MSIGITIPAGRGGSAETLYCVECDYTTDDRGDANEHEFNDDHHVMDKSGFEAAAAKLASGVVK